jgi:hypothetical protein
MTANSAAQSNRRITVPAGTRILIRMIDSIDSSKQKTGNRFTASLELQKDESQQPLDSGAFTLAKSDSLPGFSLAHRRTNWRSIKKPA